MLVLAALALISFMAIAILTFERSEDRGSRASADLVQVRMLSTLPEKLVISQIRRATGGASMPGGRGLGMDTTWTSQPGMIRVFGNKPDSAGFRAPTEEMFKLYSARLLTTSDPTDLQNELLRTQDWMNSPPEFVDLNEPVLVQPTRQPNTAPGAGTAKPRYVFPILDPFAQGLVDGFEVYTSATAADGGPAPAQAPAGGFSTNAMQPTMAMPVTWLYVLQDGSIVAPSGSQNGIASFGTPQPSSSNPIVARVAYWTDDDSCKLNINTATEPAPWDSPHTHTTTDETYAASIPAKGEHYRESGHPAFTSLSPVLRNFNSADTDTTGLTSATTNPLVREPNAPLTADSSSWWQHISNWHSLLPRTFDTSLVSKPGTAGGTQTASVDVQPKQGRMFATVDEFIFNKPANGPAYRVANNIPGSTDPDINSLDLSKVRFFLTTHNRAPELNLFNRPKISLWPLQATASMRNSLDSRFAFASTMGPDIYYFQRQSEWVSEASPGSSQDQDKDMSITRNQNLLGYLQALTELPVPGFGGSFVDTNTPTNGKWTAAGATQLITSMFDFIRWGANPATPYSQAISDPLSPQYASLAPSYSAAGTADGIGAYTAVPMRVAQAGETVTSRFVSTNAQRSKGQGRFPTITQASLVFAATDCAALNGNVQDVNPSDGYGDATKKIEAFLVIQPYCVAPGVTPAGHDFQYRVVGLQQFHIAGQSLGFAANGVNRVSCPQSHPIASINQSWGGEHGPYNGFISQFLTHSGALKTPGQANADLNFPFCSAELPLFPILAEGKTLPLDDGSGNGVKIQIYIYEDSGTITAQSDPVQVLEMYFPPALIPVPLMSKFQGPALLGKTPAQRFAYRFTPSVIKGVPQLSHLILPGDVVRSVEMHGSDRTYPPPGGSVAAPKVPSITQGDVRLLSGRIAVEYNTSVGAAQYFAPHPLYFESRLKNGAIDSAFAGDSLQGLPLPVQSPPVTPPVSPPGVIVARYQSGSILPTPLLPSPLSLPAVPAGMMGAFNIDKLAASDLVGRPGDFDTGPGVVEDGPYINMPDFNNGNNQSKAPGSTGGYFQHGGLFGEENGVTFSPWRQISSAIAFGSLPSGVYGWAGSISPRPWQTLLFCPNPPSRTTPPGTEPQWVATNSAQQDHFGFKTPRDHLLLENFWMPPVDADGLSEGFSTEGKVNMNYHIMPFQWIKRATAMYGALHGVRITAIPSQAVTNGSYKGATASPLEFRYAVDPAKTLAAFDDRCYNPGTGLTDVFRSPSEICEMFLIPQRLPNHTYSSGGVTALDPATVFPNNVHTAYQSALQWWEGPSTTNPTDGFEATGDNLREAPYAQLYPRLCTRSNVFTVHYRVQLLRKSRSTPVAQWVEGKDNVTAEYRGESTIERYLDPATTTVPDFATANLPTQAVDDYYKYRIVRRKQFAP